MRIVVDWKKLENYGDIRRVYYLPRDIVSNSIVAVLVLRSTSTSRHADDDDPPRRILPTLVVCQVCRYLTAFFVDLARVRRHTTRQGGGIQSTMIEAVCMPFSWIAPSDGSFVRRQQLTEQRISAHEHYYLLELNVRPRI
jgi:hypothetical protein